MPFTFYNSKEYREKQSAITKENWEKGLFNFHYKRERRLCGRKGCHKQFEVTPANPKQYCSSGCAAIVNNRQRGPQSVEVRAKISAALKGRKYPMRAKNFVEKYCENPRCKKLFLVWPYMLKTRKFCSNQCAMDVIGGRPTSHRASRGKAGIRVDISPDIYFYSRWEANLARLYTYLGIAWLYAPTSFDLEGQTYTPDFYLPRLEQYVEVKNFWWKYSKERDEKFRKLCPEIKLKVILKPEYLALEEKYASAIPNWEYRNSLIPQKD